MTYYPGSKQKQKNYGPDYEPPRSAADDDPNLGPSVFYGVHGKTVEFFKVGSLAAVLHRKPVTIRKWETEGIIPKTPYVAPSEDTRGRRRLYTREQIIGLRNIAAEEGILFPSAGGSWKPVLQTDFKAKAEKLFKELEG